MQELFDIISSDTGQIFIRLAFSLVLGLIIGLERELISKSAGLRTQALVCLGSTIFTLLSIYSFEPRMNPDGSFVPADPARIAAQIVTGVGFIGGGVILKAGGQIQGITTAASLWMAAAVGMAVGCGSYEIAFTGTGLSVLVLIVLLKFEQKFIIKYQVKTSRIRINIHTNSANLESIKNFIHERLDDLLQMDISKSKKNKDHIQITITLDVKAKNPTAYIYKTLIHMQGYHKIFVKDITYE